MQDAMLKFNKFTYQEKRFIESFPGHDQQGPFAKLCFFAPFEQKHILKKKDFFCT
jgi:hypothetical protein